MCQKLKFSEKKKNMVLHTIISGPNVEAIHMETLLNCQQTPGRAAKVVSSTQKTPSACATLTKVRAPDGYGETTKVAIKVNFDLDPNLNWGQNFNQQRYIEKIGADLNQYARHLMSRDIITFGNMTSSYINNFVHSHNSAVDGRRQVDKISLNYNNQNKIGLDKEAKRIGIDINIPKNIIHVLGHQKAHKVLDEIQREIETIANNRLENEVKREMALKSSMMEENHQLKNALSIANNRVNQLSAELHQMHLQQNYGPGGEHVGRLYENGHYQNNIQSLQNGNNIHIQ